MDLAADRDQAPRPVLLPVAMCAVMVAISFATHALGGPSPVPLLFGYFVSAVSIGLTALAIWVIVQIWQAVVTSQDRPLAVLKAELRSRLALFALPIFVFPTFLAGFTAAKSAMAGLVGFRYDLLYADLDRAIFGLDPWRLTHAQIGQAGSVLIELFYVPLWVAVLGYSLAMMSLFAPRRTALIFFTAMISTWLFGGIVLAYLLPAAGPTLAHLADPEAAARFMPLKEALASTLSVQSSFLVGPAYLSEGIGTASYGGGISAMPSMHVGAAAIYVLAARGTGWIVPAWAFAVIIFIGSVHSGYHYAVDGIVAAAVACLCWSLAERLHPSDSRCPREALPVRLSAKTKYSNLRI